MINKLTYKIQNTLLNNEYTDIIVKNKTSNKEVSIKNANIKFRYEPIQDKGYLSFGECRESTICEVEDKSIIEVVIYNDSLKIETNEKSYYCYKSAEKKYF